MEKIYMEENKNKNKKDKQKTLEETKIIAMFA